MGGSGWHDRRWCARDQVEHHTTLRTGGVPRDLSEARWFSIMLQAADLEATDIAAFYFPLWLKPDRRVIPRGDAYWRFRTRRIRDRIRRRWNRDQVYQMGINISSCSDLSLVAWEHPCAHWSLIRCRKYVMLHQYVPGMFEHNGTIQQPSG